MTQSHLIMRQAVIVGIFVVAGCAPDLGPEVEAFGSSNRSEHWPDLLTSSQIAALSITTPGTIDELADDAAMLERRAAALRARAAAIARKPVLTQDEKQLLQQAAAAGQP